MIHLIHIHWIKISGISELVVLGPVLANGEKVTYVRGDSLCESSLKRTVLYIPVILIIVQNLNS